MANIGKQTRQGFRSLLVNDILKAREDCQHPERIKESYFRCYHRSLEDGKMKIDGKMNFGEFVVNEVATWIDNRIDERLSELGQKVMNRKDVKYSASLILTKPSQVPQEDEKKFFEGFERFCWKYFGASNMLCYAVHFHEVTPHAQAYGMPVVDNKLNSAKWHTRRRYQSLHDDLQKYMDNYMGYHVEIRLDDDNPRKKQNSVSVNTLKDRTNKEAIKDLTSQVKFFRRKYAEAVSIVNCLKRTVSKDNYEKLVQSVNEMDKLSDAELDYQYSYFHGQRVEAGKQAYKKRSKGKGLAD